jgi:hypothetical protein
MFVAINTSPAKASSGAPEDTEEDDDNSRPSLHFDQDKSDDYAGTSAPVGRPPQVLLRNSSTPSGPPGLAMDIRAVKVLNETSDGYSVTYNVRMSDKFIETVCDPPSLDLQPFLLQL